MSNKILISFMALVFSFGAGPVLAQDVNDEETVNATEAITLDENIQAQDLGINTPTLLPDSPFYFFKEWGRGVQSFFTFNPVAKAELKEKFSNEKLLEVRKMVEENKNQKQIKKAIQLYQREIGEVEKAAQKIKEKAEENVEVGKFLDKFIQQQTLHQRVLQQLEEQVPTETFEKIREARERHLERFGGVMTRLENKEKLQERLEKNLQEMPGSDFKIFKNLEILKELEEKVPAEAKEAIKNVQESSLLKLKNTVEQMTPETQETFQEYVEKISGNKESQMEIMENLRSELLEKPQLREELLKTREKLLEKIEERPVSTEEARKCPAWTPAAPGFCKDGRVVVEKSSEGCLLAPKCLVPGEFGRPKPMEPCITLWKPVCGENGKTYSNSCFAKAAGTEVAKQGRCGEVAE